MKHVRSFWNMFSLYFIVSKEHHINFSISTYITQYHGGRNILSRAVRRMQLSLPGYIYSVIYAEDFRSYLRFYFFALFWGFQSKIHLKLSRRPESKIYLRNA